MGLFLESEKVQQAKFKASSPTFSDGARADGLYKTKFRPYCLPREYSAENLFPGNPAEGAGLFQQLPDQMA